jgi:hypothetical protein
VYGCQTWSLTLREEHRPGLFENRVLKKIFGPKRSDVTGSRENYTKRSFMIFIPREILCGQSDQYDREGRGVEHVCGKGEV